MDIFNPSKQRVAPLGSVANKLEPSKNLFYTKIIDLQINMHFECLKITNKIISFFINIIIVLVTNISRKYFI